MTKLLLSATISFLFAGSVYAADASCMITKRTKSTVATAKTDADFGVKTTIALSNGEPVEFTLTSTKYSPDSSEESIVIDQYTDAQCKTNYDSKGVNTTCNADKVSMVSVVCVYYPYTNPYAP